MNFSTSLYPQPNLSWQLLESNQMVTLVCTDINVPKYSHGHSLCTHIFTMYVSFYLGAIYPLVTRARHLAHAQLSAMINPTRVQSIVIRCIIFISWNYCTDLTGENASGTWVSHVFYPILIIRWVEGVGPTAEGAKDKVKRLFVYCHVFWELLYCMFYCYACLFVAQVTCIAWVALSWWCCSNLDQFLWHNRDEWKS